MDSGNQFNNGVVGTKRPLNSNTKPSGLSIAAFILSLLGCTSLIGLILGIIDVAKKNGRKKGLSIAAIIISVIGIIASVLFFVLVVLGGGANAKISTTASRKIPKDEYISQCQELDYKDIKRSPDTYKGQKMRVVVQINQVIHGDGFIEPSEYYRALSNDDYGMWMSDEYVLYDARDDKSTNIIEGDYLEIYGDYNGTTAVTRALTNTTDYVPSINVLYFNVLEEKDAEIGSVDSKVLEDNTINVEFDGCKYVYKKYEITQDYDRKDCLVLYFTFTNNSEQAASPTSNSYLQLFQNGVECNSTILFDGPEECNNAYTEVKKGASITYAEVFELKSKGDVEIELTKLFGGLQDKMDLKIQ